MAEVDLITIKLNLKDQSIDFSVPAAADSVIRARPHDVLAMLEKLVARLRACEYPFSFLKGEAGDE